MKTLNDKIAALPPERQTKVREEIDRLIDRHTPLDGVQRIQRERNRQKSISYTRSHDERVNTAGELVQAARAYLAEAEAEMRELWPSNWAPPKREAPAFGRSRNLEKAGALIAAELDRLSTVAIRNEEPSQ
jgi:predicted S18 family serine protease